MRGLKICLWIAGILCLLSVVGLFLPIETGETMARYFGIESLPDSPLFLYTARLMSATFAGIGVFFIILALRPTDYGIMVPFSGLATVVLGVVCGITGFAVGMPNLWFLGDSLSCLVLGILILAFWQQAKQASRSLSDTI
jgi:hypothetical protein